jgi:hypothetical protein
MKNSCLNFLFFCALSGVFVFVILGFFTLTDNPFLLIENIKKDKDGEIRFDEYTKKRAYLQYFVAALFDSLFALLIYILNVFYDNKTKNTKSIIEFQSIPNNQINQGNQINIIENQNSQPINSVGTQGNNIENNLNISNEINTNVGMSEKDY